MRARMNALLAATAAVLAAGLGTTSSPVAAAAATTWTVRPGGPITATAGKTTLTDVTTGTVLLTCTSSQLPGRLKSGSGLGGSDIGSLTGGSFRGCTGPPGLTFTVTLLDLPWHINFTSYSSGVINGTISHMEIGLAASGCGMVIDGTAGGASDGKVRFTYTDSTGKLKILKTGGNLHIYDVTGCFGLVSNGDAAAFTATYTITPRQVITSP